MRIRIGVPTEGPDAADPEAGDAQDADGQEALADLYAWLSTDPDVRRETALSLTPGHRPGTMSSAVDVIDMVLGHMFSAANFVLAYAAYRHSRKPSRPNTFTEPDTGRSITLHDGSDESMRRLREWLDDRAASPGGEQGEGQGGGQDSEQGGAPGDGQGAA